MLWVERYNYIGFEDLQDARNAAAYIPSYNLGTDVYTYGDSEWKDLLTAYNGHAITYDAIGNPLTYYNGADYTMTWRQGRRLSNVTTGGQTINYEYDSEGKRTGKQVGTAQTTYLYAGGRLVSIEGHTPDYRIDLLYDESGVYGCIYNDASHTQTKYRFVKNAQGDIIQIRDQSDAVVANYTYDAWGALLSVTDENGAAITASAHIALRNPIRYRGYLYDSETGFYLTGTRYYDPEIGRFISPDTTDVITATPMALTDKNLYAYCDNNPVVRADHSGEFWNYVIGGVVGAVVGGVSAAISGGDWKAIALGAGVGAVGGLLAASGVPAGFQIVAGGLLSGGNNLATQTLVEGKSLQEVDWIDVGIDTAIGAGTSALSYGVTRNASKAADKIICKGANKVVKGQQSLLSGSRYGKGAIKKGTAIMNSGIKQMNTVRGTSSVVGSTSGGFLTSVKSFFKRLFR